ncbi:asparagine synthase (glutamine-hydrolyzing) [Pseudopedobacter sp.]|uniref:asparagine synthase (glutamine-hydrolyzing) n=1 Tax=Pseudopedobacter sp. TaxID=1936787 RepID=UPI00333F23B4
MCGFVGFIDYRKKSSQAVLVKMCDVIQHRGPDAGNYFFEEQSDFQIGLGHRRLSIIDLHSTANQPMFYKDWVIVFNGEIYNFREIRSELIKLGHVFDTNSDTEVILQSFEEWHTKSINKFIGMFAFLLFNRKTQEVFTVRDRPGVKPLHVYKDDGIIMWASEIKSFLQHPMFVKKIDLSAIKTYLQLGHIPTPFSIYKGVSKQFPGTICKYSIIGKQSVAERYWDVTSFYLKDNLDISYEEAKSKTLRILESACNYRLVADVPVGVFLSGGYDSTLVTSIIQTNRTDRIKTFTIGVEDEKINEAKFAREIANRLGTDHTEHYIHESDMLALFEGLPYYYDEPFGDSSAIPTMLVSKIARQSVSVALSADGGDEVFGGYNRYDKLRMLKRFRILKNIPLPYSFLINSVVQDRLKAERIISLLKYPNPITLSRVLNNPYSRDEIDDLFLNNLDDYTQNIDEKIFSIKDDLKSMMAMDYTSYLLDDILVKVDRATMRFSLEGREPLLDHRLIEFAAGLPDSYKINGSQKKYILKDIVHDFVPKEVMERPKMGFAAPIKKWLRKDLVPLLDEYFSENFLHKQGIFNVPALKQMINDFKVEKNNINATKVWYLLVFQIWFQKWMVDEK